MHHIPKSVSSLLLVAALGLGASMVSAAPLEPVRPDGDRGLGVNAATRSGGKQKTVLPFSQSCKDDPKRCPRPKPGGPLPKPKPCVTC
jgi:hypothetical protein